MSGLSNRGISKWWRRHPRWRAFWWGFFHPIHHPDDRDEHCRRIVREAEATARIMRPDEAQAYRHYFDHRPDDPEERAWLRRRFGGQK